MTPLLSNFDSKSARPNRRTTDVPNRTKTSSPPARQTQPLRNSKQVEPSTRNARASNGEPSPKPPVKTISLGSIHDRTSSMPSRWMTRVMLALRRSLKPILEPLVACILAGVLLYVWGVRTHIVQQNLPLPMGIHFASILSILWFLVWLFTRVLVWLRERTKHHESIKLMLGFASCVAMTTAALFASTLISPRLDGQSFLIVYFAFIIQATFATRLTLCLSWVFTLSAEAWFLWSSKQPIVSMNFLIHTMALFSFGLLNHFIFRSRIETIAARAQLRIHREIERMHEQARSFRVESSSSQFNESAAGLFDQHNESVRSAVEEIHCSIRFALNLLRQSLGAHSAVLLFESIEPVSEKRRFKVCEAASELPMLTEGPFNVSEGVIGAVVRRRAPVVMQDLRTSYRIPYYPRFADEHNVYALMAVPLLEDNSVCGILCVDRASYDGTKHSFNHHDEQLVVSAAHYILRAIENERVFAKLERTKAEQGQLYFAVQKLSEAITEAEVLNAGVESARAIAHFDLAAITIVHEHETPSRIHEVRAVAGVADFESLVGLRFGDNGSLVAQAVKNHCSLPHRGDHDPATQVIFTKRHPIRIAPSKDAPSQEASELRSVLIVPLILRDRVLGTLVLGSQTQGAFREFSLGAGSRATLEVLASHLATSLANARMFAKLEELATTDGLTGLLNKRVLIELGTQKIGVAARYARPLSMIQTDIDHFKKINDTYGHDVGDRVIKGLAEILRKHKRSVDYVARFGGEEFVILCEETDTNGAIQLAERIREELARTTFTAPAGSFHVTCSLGVASYPYDGDNWEALYKATDEALYVSKRSGRNQTTVASVLRDVVNG